MSSSPSVPCPNCGTPVPLTEALAAPLIEATRRDYEARLKDQQQQFARQQQQLDGQQAELTRQQQAAVAAEQHLAQQKADLARQAQQAETAHRAREAQLSAEVAHKTEAAVAEQLANRLATERQQIVEAEQRRAQQRVAEELAERDRDAQAQAERIQRLSERLSAAQQAEANFTRRQQEFADRERALPLQIEREVSGRLEQVRASAATEAETRLSLKLSDKDRTINDLLAKLEDASRKAQQGSQQAQGETLELVLEDQLRRQFPFDELLPVPKGEFGGDTLHIVRDTSGRECGRILWEFKRTKVWQGAWLPKLRNDQRSARADLAVLISQAMPPDVPPLQRGRWHLGLLACLHPARRHRAPCLAPAARQPSPQRRRPANQERAHLYLPHRPPLSRPHRSHRRALV